MTEMANADHAVRNQQMIMLALALTAAKALGRNRVIIVIGLAGVAVVVHRRGAAASAALKRWAADNAKVWRHR
jgi:hypothetical protein